jgi:hypothetical protein
MRLPTDSPLNEPPGLSRKFLFALRDTLPIPEEGFGVNIDDDGHLSLFEVFVSSGLDEDVRDTLIRVGQHLVEAPGAPDDLPTTGRGVALAQVMVPLPDPYDAVEHLLEALALLEQASRAMLRATDSSARPVTSRRLYPWVVVLDRDSDGAFAPAFGTHLPVFHKPTAPPDAREVAIHLTLDLEGDIMTRYEDLWLSARRYADVDGDFTQAVLAAATASEFLIKQTAWAIEWEAAERGDEPAVSLKELFEQKPGGLIGSVFTRRLGGNWSTQTCRTPAGSWRHHVAQVRNSIMHRGARATEWEALLAIQAEERLCGHLTERVMARRAEWPRTANVLALTGGPKTDTPRHEELAAFRAWVAQSDI